jgi:chaperone protein EcpD
MKKGICAMRAVLVTLCLASASAAQANVIVAGTRVIFSAKEREVTLRLTNDSARPALVEAWIDDGDPHATPDKVRTPFLITPPLFRMDPNKDQSLRILSTAAGKLPADRESLFYLNVLEIPPKATAPMAEGKNVLQFSIRSRLKLFYRPEGLVGDPAKAPAGVTWKVVNVGKDYALEVRNPTPYHITFLEAKVGAGGQQHEAAIDTSSMVDPFGTLRLPLPDLKSMPAVGTPVDYAVVNDYGAAAPFKGGIAP